MLSNHEKNNASISAMLASESVSIEQLNVKDHSFNIDDFIEGKVDIISAFATNEPGVLKERNIPFNMIDPINYGIDFYGINIFTSAKTLKNHPEQAENFVKASIKGWQYALTHKEEIIDLILNRYSKQKTRQALTFESKALERFILPDHIPIGTIDLKRMERIVDIYKQLNILSKPISLTDFINPALLYDYTSLNLTPEEIGWIRQHPKVVIGIDPNWAPLEFIDHRGEYSGISSEYIKLIAKKTGLEFIVQDNHDWKAVVDSASSGKLDMLPAIIKNDRNSQYLNFFKPHINYPMVIVTNKDKDFIGSLKEMEEKEILVLKGCVTEDLLRNKHPEIRLKEVDSLQEGLKMLASGDAVALADNLASVSYNISKLGLTNLRISGTTKYDFGLSFAIQKNNALLSGIIQKTFDSITDEEHEKIRKKWIPVEFDQPYDYKKIIQISAIVLFIMLLILLWNWRLSREIKARNTAELELHKNQKTLEFRNLILEMLSNGTHLKKILRTLVQNLEQDHPEMIGSILLLDPQKKQLIDGVAISLPDSYMQAIDGLNIGSEIGSCGTAAYTGKRIIVEDITTHPYWKDFKELALNAGIRACWSQPVISSNNKILATFAIYYRQPKTPTETELDIINEYSILTSLAIENYRNHERLKKLSLAVEQTASVIIITNKQGIIEYVNPKFTQVTGYQSEEIVGKTPNALKSNNTTKETYSDLWSTLLSGQKWQGEISNRKKNGELYWVWTNIAPIFDAEEEITHFIAVQKDFTQRRNVEEALKQSELQFRNLVEKTKVVAWEVELKEFNFTYVSPHAVTMLGYPLEDWLVKNFWVDHIVFDDRQQAVSFCMNETLHGRDHSFEYRMIKANDDTIWLRDIVTVNKNEHGKPTSLSGFFIDIDEIKKHEQALIEAKQEAEQANNVKSEFLATMSHELRTPMNGVLGMAQILKESKLNNEQNEHVDIILRSGNSLLAIINDVLDLSKLEAEQLKLENRTFNLQQLSKDVIEMFISETRQKNVSINLNYPENCPEYFIGDPLRLQQILLNLVANAVKFTYKGSVEITINCQQTTTQTAELTIAIIDTGIGIAEDEIQHLFAPFIQADQTAAREFGGTGLGLSISKKLIRLMQGDISVESVVDQGSTFKVSLALPYIQKDTVSLYEDPAIANNAIITGKILLVEDDKINQKVALIMMNKIGLDVDIAENGQQAIMKWQLKKYDLIFMDCRMPVMDGYQATKNIRQQDTKIPIIALTANSNSSDKQHCLELGMNDVVTKPFKKKNLVKCLSQWLPTKHHQKPPKQQKAKTKTSEKPDNTTPRFNSAQLKKFRDEMGEDFANIYQAIIQGFDDFFITFDQPLEQLPAIKLSAAAHDLKSRATLIGAKKLSSLAAEIELSAKTQTPEHSQQKITRLKHEYDYILEQLSKELT